MLDESRRKFLEYATQRFMQNDYRFGNYFVDECKEGGYNGDSRIWKQQDQKTL